MSCPPRGHDRPRHPSLQMIYILFGNHWPLFDITLCNWFRFLAVIFFVMLILLIILSGILLYRLTQDEERLQLFVEHYSRNWLSVLILVFAIVALFCAFVVVLFSFYMLCWKKSSPYAPPNRSAHGHRRYFNETTSTSTVTRTRPDNRAQRQASFPKRQQRLVENIHVEKSITFH